MRVSPTPLPGMLVIEPDIFGDHRGAFLETYRAGRYRDAGVAVEFVQDNLSRSVKGVLRGLHFTVRRPQAQLVWVSHGEAFDVAVDLRRDSPAFGRWHGVHLDGATLRQAYLPPGFAHGFVVLSDTVDIHYKVSHPYDPTDEFTLRWDDSDVAIAWPLASPSLNARDAAAPTLRDLGPHQLCDVAFSS